MSEVKFSIKINVAGKEQIVQATADAKEFADAFEGAKSEAVKLRDSLLTYNQVSQSLRDAYDGFSRLTDNLGALSAANRDNVEVQTKLGVNMRNMMDATDADVESILRLCEAEQGLGVISDDIQLQGAQELATYLEKKSSLEQLIPVMNDMVAQQYGFNATQEAAQNIATMLGKVMDGQVGALSRYGYKFDEVQEQVLKFGTEEERAAVLAEVVSSAVGGMNHKLGETETGRIMQLREEFNGVKDAVGAAYEKVESTVESFRNIVSVVTSVGQTLNGVRGTIAACNNALITFKQSAAMQQVWTSLRGSLQATRMSMFGFTAATTTAKIAVVAFYGALSLGLTLAIQGVIELISRLTSKEEDMSEATDEATAAAERARDAEEASRQAYSQTSAQLQMHIAQLQNFKGSKDEEQAIVTKMNNTYGETMGYFSSVADWYKALTANSEVYCRQMVIEAQTRQLANQLAAKRQEAYDIAFDSEGNRRHYDANRIKYMNGKTEQSDLDKAQAEYNKKKREELNLQRRLNQTVREGASLQMKVKGVASVSSTPTTPKRVARGTANIAAGTEKSAVEGSLRWYEEEIRKLDDQIKDAADANVATELAKTRAALQETLQAKKMSIGLEVDRGAVEGSIDWMEERLMALRSALTATASDEEAAGLNADITVLESELKQRKIKIGLEAEDVAVEVTPSITAVGDGELATGNETDKRLSYQNAQQRAQRIQNDYEIGLTGYDEALQQMAELNLALEELGLKPIEIPVMTDDLDKADQRFNDAADAVKQLGGSFSGLGDALELPALDVMGTIAQAIANIALSYSKALTGASSMGPWAWVAFAATGLAEMTAVISSVKSVAKFANGGIAYGPTLGLFGEYAGASSNPEVVAPLDKLRGLLNVEAPRGSGRLEWKLRGRDLVAAVSNETHISRKKSNIRI